MARGRRYLIPPEMFAAWEHMEDPGPEVQAGACPEAAGYTNEEVEDFLAVCWFFDNMDRANLVVSLKRCRLPFPTELAGDEYRLSRFVMRRWLDPAVRDTFMARGFAVHWDSLAKLKRRADPAMLAGLAAGHGAPVACAILRRYGMADLIPMLLQALPPDELARREAYLRGGRALLHRFVTEPEPPRRPSRWDQQKLARRVRLRDVQMRSMRRSLHTLRRERKELLTRLREAARLDPRLGDLAAELAQLRAARAEAERLHAAALAEQAGRHRERIAAAQAEMAEARRCYAEALAVRAAWATVTRRR